jgi:hypothetical protein
VDKSVPARAGGNDAAVTVIDQCRALVHEGEVAFVACVMVKDSSELVCISGGKPGLEFTAMGGAEMLKDELKEEMRKRINAPVTPDAPANKVFYNCTRMPLAYDFLPTLIQSEMRRVREGAPAPLRVAWFWGANPSSTLRTPWQKQCFLNVLRQMPELIGAIEDNGVLREARNMGEVPSVTSYYPIIEAYNRGEPLPKVRAPKRAVEEVRKAGGQGMVTITLRETEHHPFRNSNISEWVLFAEWLKDRGENVVFIRDTRFADEPIQGQRICPDASKDLRVRTAFYELAKCNLFVSNGPAMLPVFMDCPWLFFNSITDERKDFYVNTKDGWEASVGIPVGGQWPWAKSYQRIVWQEDKFEHMQAAWKEHVDNGLSRLAG